MGEYSITVTQGSITTPGVEIRDGVLTIEPAPLTITANSYTRYTGQPNPAFDYTVKGYRNRETDTVFTARPVVTCEATVESPAGQYEITVSGAEARNYTMTYVQGTLTIEDDPSGITELKADEQPTTPVFDLLGRRSAHPRRGLYLQGRRKVVVK